MVVKILSLACVLGVINISNAASAPIITPCKADDSECIKQNAVGAIPLFADGIKELGVETLDPIFYKHIDASSPNLKFLLDDITVTGIKSCKANKFSRDTSKSTINMELNCTLGLDGDYELSGNVLVLTIRGKGKIHVLLKKLVINVIMHVKEKVGKDGEKHFHIHKFSHTYELLEKSDVAFGGLFEDNAVLRQATEEVIKNSGNEIVREIGGKVFEVSVTKIVKNINNMFNVMPIKDLALD